MKMRGGSFTSGEFDDWFVGREFRRRTLLVGRVDGDCFILGMGQNGGTLWAERLELLQYLVYLGEVDAQKEGKNIRYTLLEKFEK